MPKSSSLGSPSGVTRMLAGFEVAVDDEVLVRVAHRRAHLAKERQPLVDPQPFGFAKPVQSLALDVLHDQVSLAVRGDAAAVKSRDVRMVERGEHLALVPEVPAAHFLGPALADELEGDLPTMHGVLGQVHLAHAANPEKRNNAVLAEQSSCWQFARRTEAKLFQPAPDGGPREELWQLGTKAKQRLDLRPQRGSARTGTLQVAGLLVCGQRARLGEEVRYAGGFFRGERGSHRR